MSDRERRTGRRQRGDQAAGGPPGHFSDYRHLVNPLVRARSFSDDHVAEIHRTSLRVLEELGIRVLHEGARERFRQAGAKVDSDSLMVHLDRALVEQALASAPPLFTLAGGNPQRDVILGGDHVAFAKTRHDVIDAVWLRLVGMDAQDFRGQEVLPQFP